MKKWIPQIKFKDNPENQPIKVKGKGLWIIDALTDRIGWQILLEKLSAIVNCIDDGEVIESIHLKECKI